MLRKNRFDRYNKNRAVGSKSKNNLSPNNSYSYNQEISNDNYDNGENNGHYNARISNFNSKKAKKKRLLSTLVLIFIIFTGLATLTYFTYYFLTKGDNVITDITGDIEFLNESTVLSSPITGVRLNKDIEKQISIRNATTGAMYVRFYITLENLDGTSLDGDLSILYNYDPNYWYLDTTQNFLYYKGEIGTNKTIDILSTFQVTSTDLNENRWGGQSLNIKFSADIIQVALNSPQSLVNYGWSQGWANTF